MFFYYVYFQPIDKKAPAPPKVVEDCKETTYGCCWDGETTQQSYDGEGCPPCEDNSVFAALCGIWEKHCHNTSNPIEHKLVKEQCHRTCNICFSKLKYIYSSH